MISPETIGFILLSRFQGRIPLCGVATVLGPFNDPWKSLSIAAIRDMTLRFSSTMTGSVSVLGGTAPVFM
jgi:hypothetical protein